MWISGYVLHIVALLFRHQNTAVITNEKYAHVYEGMCVCVYGFTYRHFI